MTAGPTFADRADGRGNNLDLIRFALACVVLQYHSFPIAGRASHGLVHRLLTLQVGGGWMAVNCFFVISGFLIAQSWDRSRGLADFARKRVLRIYPGFVVAVAACIFVFGPLGADTVDGYFTRAATYRYALPLVGGPVQPLPGVLEHAPWPGLLNGSLWSIRYELACYALLAALGRSGLLRRRRAVAALCLLAWAVYVSEAKGVPRPWDVVVPYLGDLWELPRCVAYFLAGVTFLLYRDRIPYSGWWCLGLLGATGAAAAVGWSDLLLPPAVAYLVFYAAYHGTVRFHQFGARGDLSYGVYLYAFPVQQLLVKYVPLARQPVLLTVAALAVSGVFAFASWRWVEQPFLRMRNGRRIVAPAAVPHGPRVAAVDGGAA